MDGTKDCVEASGDWKELLAPAGCQGGRSFDVAVHEGGIRAKKMSDHVDVEGVASGAGLFEVEEAMM